MTQTTEEDKTPKQYGQWLSNIRYIAYYDGMSKRDVEDQININTIQDMFTDNLTPRQAYESLMRLTTEERRILLEVVISEVKINIMELTKKIQTGDHEEANNIKNAAYKLQKHQTDYNRLYKS